MAVIYFMAKSCLHLVINYLWPKYAVFVPLRPASTEFRNIQWKHRNSAEMDKFRSSAQNYVFCGKLWSLYITPSRPHRIYSYNNWTKCRWKI